MREYFRLILLESDYLIYASSATETCMYRDKLSDTIADRLRTTLRLNKKYFSPSAYTPRQSLDEEL